MAYIKIIPLPGPKGDQGIQGEPGANGSGGLENVKSQVWSYPSNNGVAISPSTGNESIAVKSQSSAALRWHVRDNSPSMAIGSPITPTSVTVTNLGEAYRITFTFPELDGLPAIGYDYNIVSENSSWALGPQSAVEGTTTTLSFLYPSDPGVFDVADGTQLNQPSIYNQVESRNDGVWIKNANWSAGQDSYAYYWKFDVLGSLVGPQLSVARAGYGNVIKLGEAGSQSIITGPKPTEDDPTAERLVIQGQDGYNDGSGNYEYSEGGDVYLWAGRGTGTYGSGGDIKLDGGNSTDQGEGGTVKMRGGYSPNGTGGFVEISSGYGGTAGGPISIISGGAGDNVSGGDIAITANGGGSITLTSSSGVYLTNTGDANSQVATVGQLPSGATGSFISQDGKTITVSNGIITGIEVI